MTKSQRIYESARINLACLPECRDADKKDRLDIAINWAIKLEDRMQERGLMTKRENTKKDYLKTMNDTQYNAFINFWDAFNYKKDRKQAAKAFYEIENPTEEMYKLIIYAAGFEAKYRDDLIAKGQTPIMAQGWISGTRWENYTLPKNNKSNNAVELSNLHMELAHWQGFGDIGKSEVERIQAKIKSLENN